MMDLPLHPSGINRILVLLRWLLNQAGLALQAGELTQGLKALGILDENGRFDGNLPTTLAIVEDPEVVAYLPHGSRERSLCEFLEKLGSSDAGQLRAVLREAAAEISGEPAGGHNLQMRVTSRARELCRAFADIALDLEWLEEKPSYQNTPNDRIVWSLKHDLASPSMIDALPAYDKSLKRWKIYQALANSNPDDANQAALCLGASAASIPAFKAWLDRNENHPPMLLPAKFQLHVGSRTLRANVFCAAKGSCLEEFKRRALFLVQPDKKIIVSEATSKTFSASVRLDDGARCSVEDIVSQTRNAWLILKNWLCQIEK